MSSSVAVGGVPRLSGFMGLLPFFAFTKCERYVKRILLRWGEV